MVRVYRALIIFAALLLSPAVHAATYHVAQRASGADDANPGTVRRPWKTLARATRHLKPGDTLILHSGIYREKITLPVSGAPAAPITLRAADGEQPVITGADEVRRWTRVSGEDVSSGEEAIYRTPWEHAFAIDEKDGQPVRAHGAPAPVGRAEQAFWWGKPLRMVLRRQQMAPDTFFIDDEEKMLYAWFPEDPGRGGAELSIRDVLLEPAPAVRGGVHYIHPRGLTFRRAANFAQRGAVRIDGSHWRIEDGVFEGMNGPGASITGTDHLLRRCTFRDNGQLGFGASRAHRLRLEACRLLHNNTKGFSSGWEAGGCKIVLTRGSVIDRCVALDNAGPGFWYDIGNEQSLVRSCYAARNEVGLMCKQPLPLKRCGFALTNYRALFQGAPRRAVWPA